VNKQELWFDGNRQLEWRQASLPSLTADSLLVKTKYSAISAGTELLVYRGELPTDISLDPTLAALQNASHYPLRYGYACVGTVIAVGNAVPNEFLGKHLFAFQPHADYFQTRIGEFQILPEDVTPEAALFLANMETAVNLVLDGAPLIGEKVAVLGQGIVGLLTTALLQQFPLAALLTLDYHSSRRSAAQALGVTASFDPSDPEQIKQLKQLLGADENDSQQFGADLIYEVSGAPNAVNLAIDICRYSGRIILGSWYGNKTAQLSLGGKAHRNHLKILSSQVSLIAPELSGRWDKQRRFELAWQQIKQIEPERWISHRVPFKDAETIYQQLDQQPDGVLQAILTYDGHK
jgi:2-desacetyl-2-hydroxyethyl bacteriochlorophyllide A dehydrogenase